LGDSSGEAHRDCHHDQVFLDHQRPQQGSTEVDPDQASAAQNTGQLVSDRDAAVGAALVHDASQTTIWSAKSEGGTRISQPALRQTRARRSVPGRGGLAGADRHAGAVSAFGFRLRRSLGSGLTADRPHPTTPAVPEPST